MNKIFEYQLSLLGANMKWESRLLHFDLCRNLWLKCPFVHYLCPVSSLLNWPTKQVYSQCDAQGPSTSIVLNWDAPGVSSQSPNTKQWKWNLYMATNLITMKIRESIENHPYDVILWCQNSPRQLTNKRDPDKSM